MDVVTLTWPVTRKLSTTWTQVSKSLVWNDIVSSTVSTQTIFSLEQTHDGQIRLSDVMERVMFQRNSKLNVHQHKHQLLQQPPLQNQPRKLLNLPTRLLAVIQVLDLNAVIFLMHLKFTPTFHSTVPRPVKLASVRQAVPLVNRRSHGPMVR